MSEGKKQIQDKQQYQKKFNKINPKPPLVKNLVWAFGVGGFICVIGQFVMNLFLQMGLSGKDAGAMTSAVMVFIGALLTGLGLYDDLGKRAGAGSIVPITGFANSIVSPAMEFKREGLVFGVGAKMFTVAGPVLVYGMTTAFVIGLVYLFRHG